MNEIIVTRFKQDEDIWYEITEENDNYISDSDTLEKIMNIATDLAAAHDIDYIKVKSETRDISDI